MKKFNLDEKIQYGGTFTAERLADVPETQINLVCLPSGQAVPSHNANSNVRLLVLEGELTLALGEEIATLRQHEMTEVEYDTPMRITNESAENTAFLVIKTPNPSAYPA